MAKHKKDQLSMDINVQVLPSKGLKIKLEPDAKQLKLLAKEADVASIERFDCDIEFRRWQKKGVSVTGKIFAQVTQQCVVTLEPVKNEVYEEIDRVFVPQNSRYLKPKLDEAGEIVVDYDGRDEPEPYGGVTLDAWQIVLEHFILGIDPFPRKEGVEFVPVKSGSEEPEDDDKISPFASLKDMFKPN